MADHDFCPCGERYAIVGEERYCMWCHASRPAEPESDGASQPDSVSHHRTGERHA